MSPLGPVTAGVDIGTTSVKAVAVDASGEVLERVRIPHPVVVTAPDRFEHDADLAWRHGPADALHRLARHRPAAVAVSSMVPAWTAVDADGRPSTPGLLYGDARGDGDGGEVAGFLHWLAAEAPTAAGYWPAPAVANRALGGDGVVDIGTAYASGPVFGGAGWDAAVCTAAGVDPALLPELVVPGAPAGRLDGGAVLAGGCVDVMAEQLVAGADQPGDVLVVCGTTLIVWMVSATERHVPGLWTTPHLTPGRWNIGGASNAGGLFLGWAHRLAAGAEADRPLDPADVPVWLPYVRGERTPFHDRRRRASLHGLDLTHGPAAVERAAWEASGFVVRHHVDLAGIRARRIVVSGGGTRVQGWMQALADSTGVPVHVAARPEGAAIGAAWLAGMALGRSSGFADASAWARTGRVVEPDPVWADAAAERYRRFRALAGDVPATVAPAAEVQR